MRKHIARVMMVLVMGLMWATPSEDEDVVVVNTIEECIRYESKGYVVNYKYAGEGVYIVHKR